MCQAGPPDMRATSSTASYYQNQIDKAHGRWLAGLGSSEGVEMEQAYAFNELQVMAEMDDIQGNGSFDPPGSQKNIHPGAGVFATNYNLPGYHARERPFSFSEERDVTTGRPIRAVPSGAVANDSSAQIAYIEQGLYPRPQPMLKLAKNETPFEQTWNVMQNPLPIKGLGFLDSVPTSAKYVGAGIVALVLVAALRKKK